MLPILHMALFWGGMAVFFLSTTDILGKVPHRVLFFLFWSGLAVSLLLPVLVAVQLLRKQWRLALLTTLCSAVVMAPAVGFLYWSSTLPCPPDLAKRPVSPILQTFDLILLAEAVFLPLLLLVSGLRCLAARRNLKTTRTTGDNKQDGRTA